jgi:hypothetical protein
VIARQVPIVVPQMPLQRLLRFNIRRWRERHNVSYLAANFAPLLEFTIGITFAE